jgi:hypothetical protein
VLLAADPPAGTTHLPEWTAWRVKVLSLPLTVTGVMRNFWFAAVPHDHWMSWVPLA